MSQRVLGASPFLTGVRRLREEEDRLSRRKHQEVTIPLDRLLGVCGIDDAGARDNLAGLEADDLEVVIRPKSSRPARTQSSE